MKFYSILFILLYVFTACESDKFLNYNYSAQQPAKTTDISGNVKHFFTNEKITNATVQIGLQNTTTDLSGNYSMKYLLTTDEQFNRPVSFTIISDGFYDLDTSLVVLPNENTFDFRLVRGAPEIVSASLTPPDFGVAVIRDYQGIANVDSVIMYGKFLGTDPNSNKEVFIPYTMRKTANIDANTARFTANLSFINPIILTYSLVRMRVIDKDGFILDTEIVF